MRLLVYTLLRLGLVLAAAGALYLLGLRSWVLWIAAVVVGALLSFLLLGRQREGAAAVLAQYDPLREERPTFSPKVEADAAYEDAVVDAAELRPGGDMRPEEAAAGPDDAVGPEAAGSEAVRPESAGLDEAAADGPGRPGDEADDAERPTAEDR